MFQIFANPLKEENALPQNDLKHQEQQQRDVVA
jgi:hypothetical protein